MKRYIKIILASLLLFGTNSCKKDFLEVVDKTVLIREGYVIDIETTEHYLNGIYWNLGSSSFSHNFSPYPEFLADNIKPNGSFYTAAYNWSYTPSYGGDDLTGNFISIWQYYYQVIRDCSFVITKVDEFGVQNPVKAKLVKGQALTIRAMMHFLLVNMFAQSYNYTADASHLGIPLIKTFDTEPAVSRQTVAEVYAGIIEDLNKALELLPQTFIAKELMNYQASKALLSRVFLFKGDYLQAKNMARLVLSAVPLMSTGYPGKLYATDDSEALFRLPPGGGLNYLPVFMGRIARLATPRFLATNDIAQLLRADLNDKRSAWVTQISTGWRVTKFPVSAAGGLSTIPENDYYYTVLRSSEMALIAAEAYAKLNVTDSAQYYIDIIRKRANPSLANISATGTALIDSIYKERRKEMCFDGLRMFDLLRWKQGVNRMDALSPSAQSLPYPSNKAIAPIPKQDVDLSGLKQNPGY